MIYDVVIPCAKKDVPFLPRVIKYIKKNLIEAHYIYIIVPDKLYNYIRRSLIQQENVEVLKESDICEGLSPNIISKHIKKITNIQVPVGWYLQQFIKYAFAESKYAREYYLTWDADTLPLSEISMFDGSHPLFTMKKEYNPNYFQTTKKLLGFGKTNPRSFIAEHMLFKTSIVKELITIINDSNELGNSWFTKILSACDFNTLIQAFSEFETYGTWCNIHYPNLYKERTLNTFRRAGLIRGRHISDKMLKNISIDLDIASFEWSDNPPFPYNIKYLTAKITNKILSYIYK